MTKCSVCYIVTDDVCFVAGTSICQKCLEHAKQMEPIEEETKNKIDLLRKENDIYD